MLGLLGGDKVQSPVKFMPRPNRPLTPGPTPRPLSLLGRGESEF